MIAIFWTTGCGDTGKKKAASVPVKGTVTLDGKPLPEGEMSFGLTGEAPVILTVKDGAFSGNAYVGNNHVEIRAYKDGPPLSTDPEKKPSKVNYLPDRYGYKSTLTAEVASGGANDFKFEVTSR
ncbi:hypothetical protein [Zavarzinella formosa]|uniref:hypothetical protein n=1 Tax=Zavarzinella formosa TaxID=360055 RepID=UPI0012FBA75B|nr:hypothetical protein [Zavarzinella formosa]